MTEEDRASVIDECIETVRAVTMAAPRPFTEAEKAAFHMFRERAIEYLRDLKTPPT